MGRKNKLLRLGNQVIELTDEQKKILKTNHISAELVQERLNDNWTLEQAISLRSNFVQKFGGIHWCYASPDETIYIPLDVKEQINLQKYRLRQNLIKGMSFEEIFQDDFMYVVEENTATEYDLALKDLERQRIAEELRAERERKTKPWLYDGTPQCVKPSKWYKHLAENDIFIKVVQ